MQQKMELEVRVLSSYLVVLTILTISTNASNVVDVGGKSLSRGTDKGMAYAKFKAHKFSYLNITSIGSDIVTKGSECGLACVNIPSCFSFNLVVLFDINTFICELLPSDKYNNSEKFVASQFHHHYSITSPCSSSPCQNNGMCAAKYEKNSYVCICAKGYTGKHCETDLDECNINSHGCDRNSYCQNTVGSYQCTCKAGYTGDGKKCNDLDECNTNFHGCHRHADCQNAVGSYNCICKAGFAGDGTNCNHPVSECNSYNTLTEANRKVTYSGGYTHECDSGLTTGWYRFTGAAGSKMPTSPPGTYKCGTHAAGWLNGAHPTVGEGQVTRQVCYHWAGNTCYFSNNIDVRNCGSFFVYNLNTPSHCYLRYCSSD